MYRPPAPVLPVRVGSPGSLASVLLTALVDTGAGKTALPADVALQLGLPVAGRTMISGFDGQPRIVPTYTVEIQVAGYNTVLRVIGLGTVALLGRDILNALSITLRGPQEILVVDVPQP
jgi:predicted aspartyl protease